MAIDLSKHLTPLARAFLEPTNATHRQYEALRAYFVDGLPSAEAAERFGYTPESFRVLCHKFRQTPEREFFLSPQKGLHPSSQTESDPERERISALRKQNLSIYDISEALEAEGWRRSPASVATIVKEEGFAPLPRRRDNERPARVRPEVAEVADVRELDLSPGDSAPSSEGCFCSCRIWPGSPSRSCWSGQGFRGRPWSPQSRRCAHSWPSGCSATPASATS